MTLAGVWTVLAVYGIELATILPAGALLIGALIPATGHRAARAALAGVTGYLASTLLAVLLGTFERLPLYPVICLLLACLWAWRAYRRARPEAGYRLTTIQGMVTQLPWPLAAIGVCAVLTILPLMTPVHDLPDGRVISYASIDSYQSLAFVQALMRHIPLAEHHSLAGIVPRVYPDYHYVHLAMLAQLAGATASDIYFVHAPVLALLLGLLLSYAVGRELTGTRLGGYVGAAAMHLAVAPNLYDLNLGLASVPVPFMPTFYQSHFFSPRYNLHEGAGVLLLTAAALALWLAHTTADRRSQIGSYILCGCFVAALSRFRSQQLLGAAPALFLITAWLAFTRGERRALAAPAAFGALLAGLAAQSFFWPYDTRATQLQFHYGDFGWEILKRWYLPARLHAPIVALPTLLAPALAVVTYVSFRVIGLNFGALIAARVIGLARAKRAPNVVELFCGLTIVSVVMASLVVRRDAITLGMQAVQMAHPLAALLAIIPVTLAARAIARRCGPSWRRWSVAGTVLLLLTGVAWRAAHAALHDQEPRAYAMSASEVAAYRWITSNTPADAVIAAHPDHKVNSTGETFRTTNLLTAMTDRRTYISRAGVDEQALSQSRADELRGLFTAGTPAACDLAQRLPVDFVIEHPDRPLTAASAPCFTLAFSAGDRRVFRIDHSRVK